MERSRAPRTHVRVSRLVHLPEIPRGIEVVVVPELSRCPIFGPPPLEIPRVVILEDVEDDMPPMDDDPVEVRPRSLGRAGEIAAGDASGRIFAAWGAKETETTSGGSSYTLAGGLLAKSWCLFVFVRPNSFGNSASRVPRAGSPSGTRPVDLFLENSR